MTHNSLDWKLGLDLINLLIDGVQAISLNSIWWETYLKNNLYNKFIAFTSTSNWEIVKTSKGICYVSKDKLRALLPVHPLIYIGHRSINSVEDELSDELGIDKIAVLNIFDFEKKPTFCTSKAGGKVEVIYELSAECFEI